MRVDKAIKFWLNEDENGYFIEFPNGYKKTFHREYFMGYLTPSNWDNWEELSKTLVNYKYAELVEND